MATFKGYQYECRNPACGHYATQVVRSYPAGDVRLSPAMRIQTCLECGQPLSYRGPKYYDKVEDIDT